MSGRILALMAGLANGDFIHNSAAKLVKILEWN